MFEPRLLIESDYDIATSWHEFWRFPQPPKECLPNNGLSGLMIMKEDIPVCMGYLYFTNSSMCWLEWIISNPEYKEKDRAVAIQLLITELSNIAEGKGFKVIFTSVKNPNLIKHYKECGYVVGSENTKEMIKKIGAD